MSLSKVHPVNVIEQRRHQDADAFQIPAFFSILSGPLLSCASASLFCLIPAHNVLEHPKFWYEFQVLAFIGLVPLFLSQILVQVNYWGDFSFENKWISNLSLSVLGAIVFALSIIGHYYLWTLVLGYTPPMAFNQYLAGSMSFSAMCIALWFWLPKSTRNHPGSLKRYVWFINQMGVIVSSVWGYAFFGSAFATIPQEYQWILGLVSPFMKDLFSKLLLKVCYKSAGEGSNGKHSIQFPCLHYMTTKHAVFLAIIVGGVSTPATTYCIIATDYAANLYKGLKIIYDNKYKNCNKSEERTMKLILGERKTLMPLTYMALILMAYFGPNAELLGNIKLRLWHYQKPIPDINAFVMNVSLFLIVDILSFVINGCLLWRFCKVNVIKLLQKLQKDFWIVFGIAEAFLLMEVFGQLCIGSGHDLTLEFNWVDGRYTSNQTSPTLQ